MRWSILLLPLLVLGTVACGGDEGKWDENSGWGQPTNTEPVVTTPGTNTQPNTTTPTNNPYATPVNTDLVNTDLVNTDPVDTGPVTPSSTSNADTLRLAQVNGSITTDLLCAFWDWTSLFTFTPIGTMAKAFKLGKFAKTIRVVKLAKYGSVAARSVTEFVDCDLKIEITFDHNGRPLTKWAQVASDTNFTIPIQFKPAGGVVGKRVTARLIDEEWYGDTVIGLCNSAPITGEDVDAGTLDVACEFHALGRVTSALVSDASEAGETVGEDSLTPISGLLNFTFE